jgi:SAM-dependent methyltransferase
MDNCIYGDMYESDKYVRERFGIYKSLLNPFLKKGVKILDIGCYMADILKILPSHINYYGVDSDYKALEIAKQRGAKTTKVNLETGQIHLNEKFDIVILAELLEHLKDPEKIIIQAKQLLSEDGVILISLPNECTLYHRFKVLFGKGIDGTGFAPHYHLHFPTLKQNDEFVCKYFKIVEKRYWFHLGIGGFFEKLLLIVPNMVWNGLTNLFPALFARGAIYLCKNG